VTKHDEPYELRVTAPAQRHLGRLTEGTAAAIVEFMLGALVENPDRVGSANSPGSTPRDEGRIA